MHVNNHPGITLRHLPIGGYLSDVSFTRTQYVCPECHSTRMQYVSFKAAGHRITVELYQYVCDLLACELHNGHRYATHIIDMETGHILWIAGGKKKQVVYDFILTTIEVGMI